MPEHSHALEEPTIEGGAAWHPQLHPGGGAGARYEAQNQVQVVEAAEEYGAENAEGGNTSSPGGKQANDPSS